MASVEPLGDSARRIPLESAPAGETRPSPNNFVLRTRSSPSIQEYEEVSEVDVNDEKIQRLGIESDSDSLDDDVLRSVEAFSSSDSEDD